MNAHEFEDLKLMLAVIYKKLHKLEGKFSGGGSTSDYLAKLEKEVEDVKKQQNA